MEQMPNQKQFNHQCELRLLVCEPNPLRPDRVTVGFVLRDTNVDSPRVEVRLASNLRAIRCIYPDADLEAIQGTLREMESVLKNVTDFEQYLQNMPAEGPADFHVLPGKALLTDSLDRELKLLEEQYLQVAVLPRASSERTDHGRAFLLSKMQDAFRTFGVWELLEKEIALDKYTFKGDPLRIDCGYFNESTNTYQMMHAVSLVTELDRAKIVALSWPRIRDGVLKLQYRQCEMTAVVEHGADLPLTEPGNSARGWLLEAGMRIEPVSSMMTIAQRVRMDLQL